MTAATYLALIILAVLCVVVYWRWRTTARDLEQAQSQLITARDQLIATSQQKKQLQAYLDAVEQVSAHNLLLVDCNHTVVWMNKCDCELCSPDAQTPLPLNQAIRSFEVLELVDWASQDDELHDRQFVRDSATYHANSLHVQEDPLLIALLIEDVTELQRLGRARRDFVANISHDLRTPITAIQVMVETLMNASGISEKKQERMLRGIADQSTTLQQLAQELLDLSLIESGRMPLRLVDTYVTEIIYPVVQRMSNQAEHKDVLLNTAIDPDLMVLADIESVSRVVQNLLHNAIKFSGPGDEIDISAKDKGEEVEVMISDSGPGVATEDLDRIFERFYKADRMRSSGGTGLGLAIARHIVEGHGGEIWVESEYGQGATFHFTLLQS